VANFIFNMKLHFSKDILKEDDYFSYKGKYFLVIKSRVPCRNFWQRIYDNVLIID